MILSLLDAMRRNFAYKLLSLAISVLLYMVASAQNNPRTSLRIAVRPTLVGAPAELGLAPESPPVSVVLTGPAPAVEAARTAVKALLDGKDAKPGRFRLPVRFQIPSPSETGVRIEGPPRAECVLEARQMREWPLSIEWGAGIPADPAVAANVRASPPAVRVLGWPHDLDRVARVVVQVPTAQSTEASTATVRPSVVDAAGKPVDETTVQPETVRLWIPDRRPIARKRFVLSPVVSGSPATGWRVTSIEFDPPTVVLAGDVDTLATRTAVEATVPIDGMREELRGTTTVSAPAGTRVEGDPTIRVLVKAAPLAVAPSRTDGPRPGRPASERPPAPALDIPGPGTGRP